MPLVVIGMVLAVLILHLIKKDAPKQAVAVIGAAGSFAAISSLLGSPLVGAFLLLEAAGIGGGLISVILLPGLVAAGVGALVFVALSDFTSTGVTSFGVQNLPKVGFPTGSTFAWSIVIGLVAAVVGTAIRRGAFEIQPFVARHKVLVTPVLGLAIGGLAVFFAEETGKSSHFVLFSGQSGLSPLIDNAATWSLGAIMLLIVCKGLAYSASLAWLQRRPRLPRHVHWCRSRDCLLPSSRSASGGLGGDGNRGNDVGGDRWSSVVVGASDAGLHTIRCLPSDLSGDLGRGRVIRCFGMARTMVEAALAFTCTGCGGCCVSRTRRPGGIRRHLGPGR